MPRLQPSQYQFLYNAYLLADSWHLNDKETRIFLSKLYGSEVSTDLYQTIKKKVTGDAQVNKWFNDVARIGFLIFQRRSINEIELLQRLAKKEIRKLLRNKEGYDPRILMAIEDQIIKNNKRLEELYTSNPVLMRAKANLDAEVRLRTEAEKRTRDLEAQLGNIPRQEP
jgi:hypothetical protein